MFQRLFGPSVDQLTPREAHDRLPRAQVLDVREAHEYRTGHIAGSVHIPLGDLRRRLPELSRDRDLVVVCRSGNRSQAAARLLAAQGFEVRNLRGGMLAWMREKLPVRTGSGRR